MSVFSLFSSLDSSIARLLAECTASITIPLNPAFSRVRRGGGGEIRGCTMGCHRLGDLKIVHLAQPNVWYIDNASTVTSVNRTLFQSQIILCT